MLMSAIKMHKHPDLAECMQRTACSIPCHAMLPMPPSKSGHMQGQGGIRDGWYLMSNKGPELVQVDDGLEVLVLPDVEMPHSHLQARDELK